MYSDRSWPLSPCTRVPHRPYRYDDSAQCVESAGVRATRWQSSCTDGMRKAEKDCFSLHGRDVFGFSSTHEEHNRAHFIRVGTGMTLRGSTQRGDSQFGSNQLKRPYTPKHAGNLSPWGGFRFDVTRDWPKMHQNPHVSTIVFFSLSLVHTHTDAKIHTHTHTSTYAHVGTSKVDRRRREPDTHTPARPATFWHGAHRIALLVAAPDEATRTAGVRACASCGAGRRAVLALVCRGHRRRVLVLAV